MERNTSLQQKQSKIKKEGNLLKLKANYSVLKL